MPDWFDESPARPKLARGSSHDAGSIDTSDVDAYRQGVELQLPTHLGVGIAKIGSGELGGRLRQSTFGMGARSCEKGPAFSENGASCSDGPWTIDGAIEAMTIRSHAMFAAIDGADDGRAVHGAVMAGSEDPRGRASLIVGIFELDPPIHSSPFVDNSDAVGGIPLQSRAVSDESCMPALDDSVERSGVRIPASADAMIASALRAMSPATDCGLVPPGFASATAGFWHTARQGGGTDSLAFGGLDR
jgi:hypothetical protein